MLYLYSYRDHAVNPVASISDIEPVEAEKENRGINKCASFEDNLYSAVEATSSID